MNFAALGNLPDKIGTWTWPLKSLAAFISGAVIVAAQPPWGFLPALLGFSFFYVFLASVKRLPAAFAYGWLFGFGYFACGLSWVANALLVEGNEFAWVWPLAVAGLPALLAIFTALACLLTAKFAALHRFSGFALFILLMMSFEWLRGHIFTGFPWSLYGYVWATSLPIAQFVALGGTYLLSLLTLVWASAPGFLLISNGKKGAKFALGLALVILMGTAYGYGHLRLQSNPTALKESVVIRLVQPNIAQEAKWNPAKAAENFQKLVELSLPEEINQDLKTVIVWPETALSQAYVSRNQALTQTAMERLMTSYKGPVYLLTGMMRYEQTDRSLPVRYYNSVAAFNGNLDMINSYNKSHLVPFGEYIPLQKWIPLAPFVQYEGFTAGDGPETVSLPGVGTYSPLVCYEIIFPGAVTARDNRPDFLVNVTNDAWYGDSAGPYQHFVKARFRAIEEGVPVVRAANTGISGVIDPLGRVMVRKGLFQTAGVNTNLPDRLKNPTLYSRWGDKIFLICLLLIFLFVYKSCNGLFTRDL